MKLIIGLGNPGKEYEKTRHNIGFRILDKLASQYDSEWKDSSKAKAQETEVTENDNKILLVKPQTFMNLSGGAITHLIQYYKLSPEDILVCYDDKDIPFGDIRFREQGSSGGHNGIKSIIQNLGTESFDRLKFGIGHEEQKLETSDFVLQRFSQEEEEKIPGLIEESVELIENWLKEA